MTRLFSRIVTASVAMISGVSTAFAIVRVLLAARERHWAWTSSDVQSS
jgi:hypothetical protein